MAMGGGGSGQPVPPVPRLGISAYQFDTECLHGVMMVPVTSFPQSLGLSASFRFVFVFRYHHVLTDPMQFMEDGKQKIANQNI